LYQAQYTQTDKLWGYFGTVTLAILAFALGSDKATRTVKEAGIVITGYLVFCSGNFKALFKAQEQLDEFARHAIEKADKAGIPFEHLDPLSPDSIIWFYWCVVVAVSIGIMAITWWRRSSNTSQPPSTP
jgi:hypothetical protein